MYLKVVIVNLVRKISAWTQRNSSSWCTLGVVDGAAHEFSPMKHPHADIFGAWIFSYETSTCGHSVSAFIFTFTTRNNYTHFLHKKIFVGMVWLPRGHIFQIFWTNIVSIWVLTMINGNTRFFHPNHCQSFWTTIVLCGP